MWDTDLHDATIKNATFTSTHHCKKNSRSQCAWPAMVSPKVTSAIRNVPAIILPHVNPDGHSLQRGQPPHHTPLGMGRQLLLPPLECLAARDAQLAVCSVHYRLQLGGGHGLQGKAVPQLHEHHSVLGITLLLLAEAAVSVEGDVQLLQPPSTGGAGGTGIAGCTCVLGQRVAAGRGTATASMVTMMLLVMVGAACRMLGPRPRAMPALHLRRGNRAGGCRGKGWGHTRVHVPSLRNSVSTKWLHSPRGRLPSRPC